MQPAAPADVNGLSDDHSELEPPDPIPNSEVKRLSADGSVGSPHVRVGHRQASYLRPPGYFVARTWPDARGIDASLPMAPRCSRHQYPDRRFEGPEQPLPDAHTPRLTSPAPKSRDWVNSASTARDLDVPPSHVEGSRHSIAKCGRERQC